MILLYTGLLTLILLNNLQLINRLYSAKKLIIPEVCKYTILTFLSALSK